MKHSGGTGLSDSAYEKVYRAVSRIPSGRVATYGQIAWLAGLGRDARRVGWALHQLKDDAVPWHRVVNAQGRISELPGRGSTHIQRIKLEDEGIGFSRDGLIDLARYGWRVDADE